MDTLERKTPMIFEQLEEDLPEDVNAVDSVVAIRKGAANCFQMPVVNSSKHGTTLRKNTRIGPLQYINSLTPL